MPFKFTRTYIDDVIHITSDSYHDNRGLFSELYKQTSFSNNDIRKPFTQVNHSRSNKNVIRGLHYQEEPKRQGKLVRVINGAVFDVAVDIREDSDTYMKWVGFILTSDNNDMLYMPEGFAHGFCSLEDNTDVIYQCTDEHSEEHERGIMWNDSRIDIKWPIINPIISYKDSLW